MLSVIRALKGQDYRLGVLCYYEYNPSIVELFRYEGVEITLLGLKREGQNRLKTLFRLYLILVKWFRRNKPDVVNVQYLAPGLTPIIAARTAFIRKIIATIHISGSHVYGKKAKTFVRISSFLTNHVICVSQGTERFWFGSSLLFNKNSILKTHKHFTIHNSIDTEIINSIVSDENASILRNRYNIPEDSFVIGTVGRLAEQKGQSYLLYSFSEILDSYPEARLLLIGDGPLKETVKKIIVDLKIGRNVILTCALPQNEVFRLYSTMDIFVMPSLYEGFGLTAAEAMAAGIPVIGTNVDGLNEIIEDKINGLLIEPKSIEKLFDAIKYLIDNPMKREELKRNAIETVQSKFSIQLFEDKTINLYTSLLNR
jgi:glycosyltransferase involved in cell wall biosynthesis